MSEIQYPETVRKVQIRFVPDGQFCPGRSILQLPSTGWPHADALERKLFARWREGIAMVLDGVDALPGGEDFKNKIMERVLPKGLTDKGDRERWAAQHIKFLPPSPEVGDEGNEPDGVFGGKPVPRAGR